MKLVWSSFDPALGSSLPRFPGSPCVSTPRASEKARSALCGCDGSNESGRGSHIGNCPLKSPESSVLAEENCWCWRYTMKKSKLPCYNRLRDRLNVELERTRRITKARDKKRKRKTLGMLLVEGSLNCRQHGLSRVRQCSRRGRSLVPGY